MKSVSPLVPDCDVTTFFDQIYAVEESDDLSRQNQKTEHLCSHFKANCFNVRLVTTNRPSTPLAP